MNEGNAVIAGRARRPVALVLFVVFMGCLAWAGLIVHQRTGQPRREAESVLATVARDGLDRTLPPTTSDVEWFLCVDSQGQVLTTEVRRHVRSPQGHRMVILTYGPSPAKMTVEAWTVANDLSTSDYRAATGLAPARLAEFPGLPWQASRMDAPGLTFIEQAKGQVTVQQRGRRRVAETASLPAPGDLIPEGAMEAVIRCVAARQRSASFYGVTNEHAIIDGKLHLSSLLMTPVTKDSVMVVRDVPGAGKQQSVYHFDPSGRVVRITSPDTGIQTVRATRRQILSVLNVRDVQAAEQTAIALTSSPLPTRPAPTTGPTSGPAMSADREDDTVQEIPTLVGPDGPVIN